MDDFAAGWRRGVALLLVTGLLACGGGGDEGDDGPTAPDDNGEPPGATLPPVTSGSWYRPTTATTWQWQLQGNINTSYDVTLYELDLFDVPDDVIATLHAAGRRVLCYFSAGSWENWRSDASLFPDAVKGKVYAGFEDERWLDIRDAAMLQRMKARLDMAVQRGCDGVEADNVDGYINDTGFPLTAADQLTFNRTLFNEAHRRNLTVALKNDVDQVGALLDYVDLAVNERCHEVSECRLLEPFVAAGKPVLNAEYADSYVNDASTRAAMCAESLARSFHTLILPVDLDDSFRFACDGS